VYFPGLGNLLGKKINPIRSEAKRRERAKGKEIKKLQEREENGSWGGVFETRIGGIAETAWEETKVRGGCL
jgi:hypothetical protein